MNDECIILFNKPGATFIFIHVSLTFNKYI